MQFNLPLKLYIFLGCVVALCTFMLLTKHLLIVYMYLLSVGTVFFSYWSNVNTVKIVLSNSELGDGAPSFLDDTLSLNLMRLMDSGVGIALLENYTAQIVLSCIFSCVHLGPKYPALQKV